MTTNTDTPAAALQQLAAEALRLSEAATPGPWSAPGYDEAQICARRLATVELTPDWHTQIVAMINRDVGLAEFIAASRTLVPQLAKAVQVLAEALEEIANNNGLKYNNIPVAECARTALTRAAGGSDE